MSTVCDNSGEEQLEQCLYRYKDELSLVNSSLDLDQTNEELVELRDKLLEIIALTEADLIGVKKARLLAQLDSQQFSDNSNNDVVSAGEPKPSTSSSTSPEDSLNTADETDVALDALNDSLTSLNGKECRVPLCGTNGAVSYHNAILMTTDDGVDGTSDTITVKAFFTYPTTKSMLSCPHYLSAKCRYSDDKCRYSHGLDVLLTDIKPYEAVDYSTLSRDSICLAKNSEDSLWHKAVVDDIRDDKIVVKYCDEDVVDSLDIEDVLPLSGSDADCLRGGRELSLSDYTSDSNGDQLMVTMFKSGSQAMAEWETHTKGIGSKLMARMGYVWGQGLGRNGEGIVEPVEAYVYPSGKSLDTCIELRDKYQNSDQLRARIKLKEKTLRKTISDGYNRCKPEDSVFDFINNKVFAIKKDNSKPSSSGGSSAPVSAKDLKAKNDQSLNVSALKISEDIRKAESELKRLQDSMARNQTRDPVMYNQLRQRVDKQNQLIAGLKRKESLINREQNSRSNKQKLSIF
ncbi:unnamed protein product [Oppiella nova]|uniref:Zinc finger CCCH-type with G patch domain-containing protein n=1 Tax=Oppiella nova TaxID=334625 RepID=A0A7R9QF21_9ACAR|nr:unnamed protein product [Oppiella nova]CAG2164477.1 unnamed protein product [Oppiella nova]